MVKPNHGSGWSIIVDRDHPARPAEIVSKCRKWLRKTYGRSRMEWAYSKIRPMVIIEKLLKDRHGKAPSDFKLEVINGFVSIVYLLCGRLGTPSEAIYDRDFSRLRACSFDVEAPDIQKPENFQEMVSIAEELAFRLDFVSVDMYNVDGRIFFGEFTLYPDSGFFRFNPVSFDYELGEQWKLDMRHARVFRTWF